MRQKNSKSCWYRKILLFFMIACITAFSTGLASAEGEITMDTATVNCPTPSSYTTSISTLLSCGNTGANPVLVGDTVTDQITFSWDAPEGILPTGSIQIYRDAPGGGLNWELIETRDLTGITSSPYVFTSEPSQVTALYYYYFKAVYVPAADSLFAACSSGDLNEKVKVIPRSTSISTLLSCGNTGEYPVLVGNSVTDQITFSWDAPAGIVPTGYIDIYRSVPGSDTIEELIETRTLDGTIKSPYVFTTEASQLNLLGNYYFRAVYRPAADSVFLGSHSGYKKEKANVYTQLKILKTVNNLSFFGPQITFEIRKNAAPVDGQFGTVLETGYANAVNNGAIDFTTKLYPGVYQLCEYVPLGYVPSYIWGTYGVDWFKPGYSPMSGSPVDNTLVAVNFTVNADGSITFPTQTIQTGDRFGINNQVGQMPLTIGFWKNHCSQRSSNGGQSPILDRMLYNAAQAGSIVQIGNVLLSGGINPDDAGINAINAYWLLDKSRINDGKKMASDPAFNLAAQLLGYKLNAVNGAFTNNIAITAANTAQIILANTGFDGTTWNRSGLSNTRLAQLTANMNYLAMVLDSYNNGTLTINELQMPYPGVTGS